LQVPESVECVLLKIYFFEIASWEREGIIFINRMMSICSSAG
jgi:hypothetical protein